MPVVSHLPEAIEIFCSYAHEDESLHDELEAHLSSLKWEGKIKSWYDRMIKAGEDWKGKIDERLETAHIILLLVSADFIQSDYCHEIEMRRAMQRYRAGEARVIPIILRPCDWETSQFSELQALPKGALPVTEWSNRDLALTNIAKGVRAVVDDLLGASTPPINQPRIPPHPFIPRPPIIGFVARRDAQGRNIVERLKEELAPQRNQLVTLSGPGGIGKTTLAAEATRALKELFGGRIVWSSAEGRADFTLSTLLDDIVTQLGRADLRTLAPDAKEAQTHALVADPPTLVMLDNYETIAPDAQKRIEEWFAQAQCSALFTSRQRSGSTFNIIVAAMSREESEEFLEKLITQTQDAQIFSGEVRQRIYETAEANPFVMQWVVGQIDAAQEPKTVLAELAQGKGEAAKRVFERSFSLQQLGDDGRAALLALSMFVPSASRPALAEVAGFGDDVNRLNEAVKNLSSLLLLRGIDQYQRLTIEGLTRSLAKARLSRNARATEFHQRFVAYFLSYAEAHAQPTPEDFDALEAEKDNLLSAMDRAFDLSDWASVIQLMNAISLDGLNGFLTVRGYWDESIRRGNQVLEAAHSLSAEKQIARFTHSLAVMYQLRGELIEARRLYNESLEIAKRLGNQIGIATTLHQLAMLAQDQGDIKEARRLYNESLEITKRLGNQIGIASTLHELGRLAQAQGHIKEARRLYNESLEIEQRLGNQRGIALSLHQLGRLAQDQGEVEEARRLYNESLEIAKRLGNQIGIATTLHQLGRLAEMEGNKVEAVRLIREALSIFEKLKSPNAEVSRRVLERLDGEVS